MLATISALVEHSKRQSKRNSLRDMPLASKAINFLTDVSHRLSGGKAYPNLERDRQTLNDFVLALGSEDTSIPSLQDCCQFEIEGYDRNLLQFLTSINPPGQKSNAFFKEFCKTFHVKENLTKEVVQSILGDCKPTSTTKGTYLSL